MPEDPLNLADRAKWSGLWWLPETPSEQVPGVLSYDPENGLSLSLIGAFEDRIISIPDPGITAIHEGSRTWEVIHGAAEHREITLFDCMPLSTSRSFGGAVLSPDTQAIKVLTALVGAHITSKDKAVFSSTEVSIEDLGYWGASSGLEKTLGTHEEHLDGSGTVSLRRVPDQPVVVDGTEFALAHLHTPPRFDDRRGVTIGCVRDTTFVRVRPTEPYSFDDALRSSHLIQDLVALAVHRAAGVIWLQLKLASGATDSRSMQLRRNQSVDVLYSPSKVGDPDMKAIRPNRTFFTCYDIPFKEIIPKWRKVHERLKPALNMILGLRYEPAQYIENALLTAVGAAEVLHRNLGIDELPIPRDEFAYMRKTILRNVPEEHRERISAAIRNDPTLRERLQALAARLDQEALSFLIPNAECWARRTTQARNALTHEGRTTDHSFEELLTIVETTTAVVILNLLNEVGLPAEQHRMIVMQHPQLRKVAQRATEVLGIPKR